MCRSGGTRKISALERLMEIDVRRSEATQGVRWGGSNEKCRWFGLIFYRQKMAVHPSPVPCSPFTAKLPLGLSELWSLEPTTSCEVFSTCQLVTRLGVKSNQSHSSVCTSAATTSSPLLRPSREEPRTYLGLSMGHLSMSITPGRGGKAPHSGS